MVLIQYIKYMRITSPFYFYKNHFQFLYQAGLTCKSNTSDTAYYHAHSQHNARIQTSESLPLVIAAKLAFISVTTPSFLFQFPTLMGIIFFFKLLIKLIYKYYFSASLVSPVFLGECLKYINYQQNYYRKSWFSRLKLESIMYVANGAYLSIYILFSKFLHLYVV